VRQQPPTVTNTKWHPHHYWTSCPRCPTPQDGARQSLPSRCSTACRLRPTPRRTSWVAWPTGLRARTASGEDASSTATATTGVWLDLYCKEKRKGSELTLHRPAGIRREPADQPLRYSGRRGGGHLLRRRQHTHISPRPRFRTRRRHCLPWTRRSARRAGATRRAGHLPACWRPWRKPVRQPARWTWRQGRTPFRLEGRQAPAQPRCLGAGQARVERHGGD
jgi:hypothetical protein